MPPHRLIPHLAHEGWFPSNASASAGSDCGLIVVGWQERIALPEMGLDGLAAKLDTGAFVSAMHVDRLRPGRRRGEEWVHFEISNASAGSDALLVCEAPVVGWKRIQSSSGHREIRPVIETVLNLAGFHWTIELTLTSRTSMQFQVLIGRSALVGRCLVDPGRTYIAGRR